MHYHRPSEQRGQAEFGWLSSRHTFSFGSYHDPQFMGFGTLRVINDDRVVPAAGFPTHPHRDMEIISYVLAGRLEHKDSMGNGSVILPGEVQMMRAGTGVTHSEYNPSQEDGLHFLQIWILPNQRGLTPGYFQNNFAQARQNQLGLVASLDGRDESLKIAQDVDLYASKLNTSAQVEHPLRPGRQAWIHVAEGSMRVEELDLELAAGDGLAVVDEPQLTFHSTDSAHFLLFDLPTPSSQGPSPS